MLLWAPSHRDKAGQLQSGTCVKVKDTVETSREKSEVFFFLFIFQEEQRNCQGHFFITFILGQVSENGRATMAKCC